jgi:hypothetical protein
LFHLAANAHPDQCLRPYSYESCRRFAKVGLGIIPAKGQAAQPRPKDTAISVEGVCAKLAAVEGRLSFVSVSHFLNNILEGDNFSEKSSAFNLSVEQGYIEVYKIPNPKSAERPTSCCRLTSLGKTQAARLAT